MMTFEQAKQALLDAAVNLEALDTSFQLGEDWDVEVDGDPDGVYMSTRGTATCVFLGGTVHLAVEGNGELAMADVDQGTDMDEEAYAAWSLSSLEDELCVYLSHRFADDIDSEIDSAQSDYADGEAYARDPYAFNGVSRHDF